jgi:peptidoglycan/LPS O-acetylase OafA/YrhL
MFRTLRRLVQFASPAFDERGRSAEQPVVQKHPTNNFDFLRLTGAVLVIYGHSYPLTGAPTPGFAANAIGTIGVKIFFVISGYLVALSWLRDASVPRYLLRRSLRIFPALIAVVLLSVVVLGPMMTTLPLSTYFRNAETTFYLRNIALYINYGLPGLFDKNVYPAAVNGSLWSLPAEFVMYLLAPLLLSRMVNFGKYNFATIAIGLAVAAVVLIRVFPRTSQFVVYATSVWSWLEVAPYFLIGAAFSVYRLEWLANIYVAFVGLLALGVFETGPTLKEALLLVVLPYAVLSFGLGYSPVLAKSTGGNDLSYGIFLFGFPVQQTLTELIGPQIGPWANFLIASTICALLAYLSWNLIERPMLSLKPIPRKQESDALEVPATG